MSRAHNASGREQPSSPPPAAGGGRGWVLPLVVVLLVIAVFIFISVAKHAEKRNPVPEPAPAVPVEPVAAPAPSAPPAIPAPADTTTNSPATNAAAALKLQGVVFNAKRPWAIVDGKTVSIGDRVSGGYRVKEITANTITLEHTNGSLRTLFLGK
jgi:hypothetical protein